MGNVTFDEIAITYIPPNSDSRSLTWSELQSVEIVTTDAGPFYEDVFWVLHGTETTLRIPQLVAGANALLVRLQQLPEFDNEAVIKSMTSTGDETFRCWTRTGKSPN